MQRTAKLFNILAALQVFFVLTGYLVSRVGLRAWNRSHFESSMPVGGTAAWLVGTHGPWLLVAPAALYLFCFLRTRPEVAQQHTSWVRVCLAIAITAALALTFSWATVSAVFLVLVAAP